MTFLRYFYPTVVLSSFLLAQSGPTSVLEHESPQAQTSLLQHPVTYGSGGLAAMSVAVADVNGDGDPDLVIASQNGSADGTVGVLLGHGNGNFQPVVAYDSGGPHAWSVAVADVNADGHPDILVTNAIGTPTVGVLLNKGDGTFYPAVTYPGGGFSIAVGDVNGDGRPDLVTGEAQVLLGNGDGTFQPPVKYGSGASIAVLSDVNGDGKLDIVEVTSTSRVGALLGNGNGTFQNGVFYLTGGSQINTVAVGDVNGDGKADIAVSNYCSTPDCSGNGSGGVLLGNGDGTFQPATTYDAGARFTNAVALADVDGDDKVDLLLGNFCQPDKTPCGAHGSVAVLLGNGNGTFQPRTSFLTPSPAAAVAVADINGGRPDVLAASTGNSVIALFGKRVTTSSKLSAAPNPSSVQQAVILTATVTPSSGHDLGGEVITFYDGQTVIGSAMTAGGVATITTSFALAGNHLLKAKLPRGSAFFSSVGKTTAVVKP